MIPKQIIKWLYLFVFLIVLGACPACKEAQPEEITMNLDEIYEQNLKDSTLMTGWYRTTTDGSGFSRLWNNTDKYYTIDPRPLLSVEYIVELKVNENRQTPKNSYLQMQFGKEGTLLWQRATGEAVGQTLAFILNDELLTTPRVNCQIDRGIATIGNWAFTLDDYGRFKQAIEQNQAEMKSRQPTSQNQKP